MAQGEGRKIRKRRSGSGLEVLDQSSDARFQRTISPSLQCSLTPALSHPMGEGSNAPALRLAAAAPVAPPTPPPPSLAAWLEDNLPPRRVAKPHNEWF